MFGRRKKATPPGDHTLEAPPSAAPVGLVKPQAGIIRITFEEGA